MLSFISVVCLVFILACPTFMLCLVYPFSKKAAVWWSNYITDRSARLVFAILKCYLGFELICDDESKKKLPEQFVLISNHQSLLDIVIYFVFFGGQKVRFVAKDSLAKVPMVGKMLKSQGHCMIPRKGSPTVAMNSIQKFGERMIEQKKCPVIFPEGTRSKDGNLRQFYAAGFRKLSQTMNLPVAVCALDGGYRISNLNSILTNLKKGFYKTRVLKVYDAPKSKEDEVKILEESQVLIQEQLDLWRSK